MSTQTHSRSPSKNEKHKESHHHHNHPSDSGTTVPWFPSPMEGWNEELECFSPRHEASTIELFFDLWFVANLAAFTQYHAITNRYSFWSYIAFFIVLWTSWFHVVCFDARFTSDSVWERACKTVHFIAFAAFALAGYKFMPIAPNVATATPHWIYRILCFALLLSRAWLALQYIVTVIMCSMKKHRSSRLTLPLALNALLFLCNAAVFGGLFAGFSKIEENLEGILIGVYVVLAVEFFGSLSISMIWHKLSFKATHIGERLGLLGLIIIGEGVIGTTKTITRTMGKTGPTFESSAQIFCIILILVFMWILYFDRVPKYRFGTVKQQFWMALHLPFHVAILGVVEGAQQLAQAVYVYSNTSTLFNKVIDACVDGHLDGGALASNLTKTVDYFKINESARGTLALNYVWPEVYTLGNETGVCSPANTTQLDNTLLGIPLSFSEFLVRTISAMYQSFDIDIKGETDDISQSGFFVALDSWALVYTYFWSAIILLELCYLITSLLAETPDGAGHWRSKRRYTTSIILSRGTMIILAIVLLVLGRAYNYGHGQYMFIQSYIASSWILPTVVLKLWFICINDRLSKLREHRRQQKQKYQSVSSVAPAEDLPEEHGPGIRRRQTNGYGYPSH